MSAIRDRRLAVIDEARGLVLMWAFFDVPGNIAVSGQGGASDVANPAGQPRLTRAASHAASTLLNCSEWWIDAFATSMPSCSTLISVPHRAGNNRVGLDRGKITKGKIDIMQKPILIARAGPIGLTLALLLQQQGRVVRVFEAVRNFKPLGVGVNLLPHSVRILHQLGLKAELDSIAIRTGALHYYNKLGQLVWAEPRGIDAGYQYPQHSIHRGRLQTLLRGNLFGLDPQARLHYGYNAHATLTPIAKAASRLADQFDGFVAGNPGFNLPKSAVQHAWDVQALSTVNDNIAEALTREDMQLVASSVLTSCDALDGLADGMVNNLQQCQEAFSLPALSCTDSLMKSTSKPSSA